MSKLLEPEVMSRLAPLALNARQPMLGDVSGHHRSPVRGSSLEFAEYRNYVPGDDTRRLDWRVWARTDRDYVKEFEADTNLRLSFVLDTSGSMNYPLARARGAVGTRLSFAKHLAATLAWLASERGEAVGLSTVHDRENQIVPPKRGPRHLGEVLRSLEEVQASEGSELAGELHRVADRLPRRSLVVILSDLFVDLEELKPALEHLRWRRHDVAIFHLLEPSELEFSFDTPVKLLDLEGAEPLLADPALMAENYRTVVRQYLADVSALVRRTQVDYHEVHLDEEYERVLTRFLLRRA